MTTNKPEAAHLSDARAEFEAWITSPPYEKPVTINPDSSAWPGQYRAYEVQLAWEAYQAGRAECEKLRKDAERYQWLNNPANFHAAVSQQLWLLHGSQEFGERIDKAIGKGEQP